MLGTASAINRQCLSARCQHSANEGGGADGGPHSGTRFKIGRLKCLLVPLRYLYTRFRKHVLNRCQRSLPGGRCRISPGPTSPPKRGSAWLARPGRKLGNIELDIVLEETDRLRSPRVALDLREIADPDELRTSEVHALGPALQRMLSQRADAPLILYRLSNDGVAQTFSDQFTLQSVPARAGKPAEPLLGLAEVQGTPCVLGPLPKYLEPVWGLLAERGELTAVDLTDAHGTALATASDYLGELHRLRIALRERESLSAGGSRFVYSLAL